MGGRRDPRRARRARGTAEPLRRRALRLPPAPPGLAPERAARVRAVAARVLAEIARLRDLERS